MPPPKSKTITYQVHLNNGTSFMTTVSREVTLKMARKTFVGQVISMWGDPEYANKPYPTCTKVTK